MDLFDLVYSMTMDVHRNHELLLSGSHKGNVVMAALCRQQWKNLVSLTILHCPDIVAGTTFQICARLERVWLGGNNLRRLPRKAFSGCIRLRKVHLPPKLEVICPYAFEKCRSLVRLEIPDGVHRVMEKVFHQCFVIEVHAPKRTTFDPSNLCHMNLLRREPPIKITTTNVCISI